MQGTHRRWRPPAPSLLDLATPGLTARDAATLTRFQRILLATDGTVTHVLEAYAGEPIQVVKLRQVTDTATPLDGHLALSAGAPVLRRRVILRGRHSGRNLLYAEAVVVLDRVSQALLDGLVESDQPIGTLLADNRVETFREILCVERSPAGACGRHFGIDARSEVICRTYRIVSGGRPIMVIAERFPPHFFRTLPT